MDRKIVLACGWHFTRPCWQNLVIRLTELAQQRREVWQFDYLDPGYYSRADQCNVSGFYDLAIGHSLGFLSLLQAKDTLQANKYVSVNGFGCFIRQVDNCHGVDLRILKRMQRQLDQNPADLLQQFRQNCHLGETENMLPVVESYCDTSSLSEGLIKLVTLSETVFLTDLGDRVLCLYATDDQVVARDLSQQQFATAHQIAIDTNSHALMLTHTDLCCQQILPFITGSDLLCQV